MITIDVVTVGSTSKTLATLLGASVHSWTRRLTAIPHADGIYIDDETASASSHPVGLNSLEFHQNQDAGFADLQFYAASDTKMTVVQEDV